MDVKDRHETGDTHKFHMILDTYDLYSVAYLILALICILCACLIVVKIVCCDPCFLCRRKKEARTEDFKKEQ